MKEDKQAKTSWMPVSHFKCKQFNYARHQEKRHAYEVTFSKKLPKERKTVSLGQR